MGSEMCIRDRVIGEADIAETNPLGMDLPEWLEKPVNRVARRLLPKAFARLDENRQLEEQRLRDSQVTEVDAA